jgi:DNA-binding response OmpR family regulator
MNGTSRTDSAHPEPWDSEPGANRTAPATVLLVEDDRDILEMMATLLEMSGFSVTSCETAETALNALREQEFDLILTDYALPRHTGHWLLENAEEEGLIQGTPVMIVTAHPQVACGDRYEVIHKPFDFDELIERVRYRVEGDGPRRQRQPPVPARRNGNDEPPGDSECPDPVELILYVSSESPRSFAALKNVKKVLERFRSSRVKLTVHDLSQDPARGIADSVAFTPTLVRKTNGPRTFILGHITNPELVLELLADCEPDL